MSRCCALGYLLHIRKEASYLKPMTPVVVGFERYETVIAKDQDEYHDLPALVLQDGRVIRGGKGCGYY